MFNIISMRPMREIDIWVNTVWYKPSISFLLKPEKTNGLIIIPCSTTDAVMGQKILIVESFGKVLTT